MLPLIKYSPLVSWFLLTHDYKNIRSVLLTTMSRAEKSFKRIGWKIICQLRWSEISKKKLWFHSRKKLNCIILFFLQKNLGRRRSAEKFSSFEASKAGSDRFSGLTKLNQIFLVQTIPGKLKPGVNEILWSNFDRSSMRLTWVNKVDHVLEPTTLTLFTSFSTQRKEK